MQLLDTKMIHRFLGQCMHAPDWAKETAGGKYLRLNRFVKIEMSDAITSQIASIW